MNCKVPVKFQVNNLTWYLEIAKANITLRVGLYDILNTADTISIQ